MASAYLYGPGKVEVYRGNVDWEGDDIKVALLADTYTPDQDIDATWDDVSTHEVSGTNYTAGGQLLTTRGVTYVAASNEVRLSADDAEWPNSTLAARYAVVYKDTGVASTSTLISYADFEAEQSSSDGLFALRWDNGIVSSTTIS